jgi:hypothetical protein
MSRKNGRCESGKAIKRSEYNVRVMMREGYMYDRREQNGLF